MKKLKKAKGEKGAITLFVLISMMFFVIVLIGLYISSSYEKQKQQQQIEQIQKTYEIKNIDDLYKEVYEEQQLYD